jgi:hypothetical protein
MAKKYFKKILAYMERMILPLQKLFHTTKLYSNMGTLTEKQFYVLIETTKEGMPNPHCLDDQTEIASSYDKDYLMSLRKLTLNWEQAADFYFPNRYNDYANWSQDLFYKYPTSIILTYASYRKYKLGNRAKSWPKSETYY